MKLKLILKLDSCTVVIGILWGNYDQQAEITEFNIFNGVSMKIEDLKITKHYSSSPDGYGGETEWNWYELTDIKSKKSIKLGYQNHERSVDNDLYIKLTGRPLSFEECCKIYNKNKQLYSSLSISGEMNDFVLRKVGKRTNALKKKIEAKKKVIKKHKVELESMLKDFNGRDPDYLDLYL